MRFQVESRTPFADSRELIETVFGIPSVYKIHDGWSKALLREAAREDLPEEIYRRRDKIGFATPEWKWLSLRQEDLLSVFSDDMSQFLDIGKIRDDWSDIWCKQPSLGMTQMWRFINLCFWVRCFSVE